MNTQKFLDEIMLITTSRKIDYQAFSRSELTTRSRSLRNNRFVPQGRENRLSHLTPRGAAWVLLGLTCGDTASQVHTVVASYASLVPVKADFKLSGADNFIGALEEILYDDESKNRTGKVQICRSLPQALIFGDKSRGEDKFIEFRPPGTEPLGLNVAARQDFTLSDGMLSQLALELKGEGTKGGEFYRQDFTDEEWAAIVAANKVSADG